MRKQRNDRNSLEMVAAILERRSEPADSGCRRWTGYIGSHGYGTVNLDGKLITTHRAAYLVAHGSIPDGGHVRHKCDNRWCINEEHLELGSHADNMRDSHERGRAAIGSRHGNAKLLEWQVTMIRALHALGAFSMHALARMFEVSVQTVHDIIHRKLWKHVT